MTHDSHKKVLTIAIETENAKRKALTEKRDILDRAVNTIEDIEDQLEKIGDLEQYISTGKVNAFSEGRSYSPGPALQASLDRQKELQSRLADHVALLPPLTLAVEAGHRSVEEAARAVKLAVEPIERQLSDEIADEVEKAEHDLSEAFLKISALSRSGPGLAAFSPKGISALSRSPRPIAMANSARALRWEAKVEEYSQLRRNLLEGTSSEFQIAK